MAPQRITLQRVVDPEHLHPTPSGWRIRARLRPYGRIHPLGGFYVVARLQLVTKVSHRISRRSRYAP